MNETLNSIICELGLKFNTFSHLTQTPSPSFKTIVRPNVDTLYSVAYLQLSAGPVVIDIPTIKDRFYLIAMYDAWSNNFAGLGTQSNEGKAETYVITGPNFSGKIPKGLIQIKAPTNLVWIIGRTELLNTADKPFAVSVQKSYNMYALDSSSKVVTPACVERPKGSSSIGVVQSLSGPAFFKILGELITAFPPPKDNADVLANLAKIGVGPYAKYEIADLTHANKKALDMAVKSGPGLVDKISSQSADLNDSPGGWSPPATLQLGVWGTQYTQRFYIAVLGFGANRNEFAVYPTATVDENGDLLDGSMAKYELRFKDGNSPPVSPQAFWSVTIYDKDSFLVENVINRYALGSNSRLAFEDNGDLVLRLSAVRPGCSRCNWLPVPEGIFSASLRMYWPDDDVLDGTWAPPGIIRLN